MQPNIIERVWRQDKGANVDVLNCFVFTGEAGAHKFVISGKNVNTPVDISGTITANFKNADGVLVPLTGTIEDGKAVVVLSRECYAVEGPFSLMIFADTVCIYAAIANAINSSGEVIAYPTATIPSVQELIEEVQDIIASIPQDYSALNQSVTDLKSAIGDFKYSITNFNDWHKINVNGLTPGDKIYVKTITQENVAYVDLSWLSDIGTYNIYTNQQPGKEYYLTVPADRDGIQIAYKSPTIISATYDAIVANISDDTLSGFIGALKEDAEEQKNITTQMFGTIDSAFKSVVNEKLNGVVAFNFLGSDSVNTSLWMENISEFRVTSFYYKASGFYMYMPVQKFVNGEWSSYDAIEILLADAPTETPLTIINSKYGYFQIAFIPSLSASGSVSSVDYRIKRAEIKPFYEKMRQLLNRTVNNLGIADYELQDHTAHIVTVKQDGSGDYTTIAAAYAAITESSFLNQYEIVVYPGTYEEVNLICPNFSHTHGLAPNTVTVTSVGKTGTQPVFEQRNGNSKLSNMTIISGTGYCVHQDSSLNGFVLVNENLHCIKDYGVDVSNYGWESKTNPSVIGDGAQYYGAKFIWRNCTFENGEVACHSNSNSNDHANQHFILENCRLVNARIWLGMAGNEGASPNSHCVAEIKGLYTPPGCQSLKYKLGARVDENEPNFIWQIIGGENENFSVVCDNSLDNLTNDMWGNINTNEKALVQISGAITKGQWLKYDLSVCGEEEAPQNVLGVALESGSSGDTIQVWIGNAFAYTATNGEYGIDANGGLSASATTKIGRVYKNILYRY